MRGRNKAMDESNIAKMVFLRNLVAVMGDKIKNDPETMDTWNKYPGYYKEELTIWNQIKQEYETDKTTI